MNENKNVKSKLVFEPRCWRALLRRGCKVIDVKPLRSDPAKTVLVFEDTPEFNEALEEIMAEIKAKDGARSEVAEVEAAY